MRLEGGVIDKECQSDSWPKNVNRINDIEEKYSTWMAMQVGAQIFGYFIAFTADGFYPRSQKFGGHKGRSQLRSYKGTIMVGFWQY